MLTLFRIASGLTVVVTLFWVVREPKFDSYAAFAAAVATFLGSLLIQRRSEMSQTVGTGSNVVQAGGDAHVVIGSQKPSVKKDA